MATYALCGQAEPVELSNGSDLVAGIAIHYGMRADKRESILMFVDVVDGNLPSIGGVAEFAFRAVLAAMQIGVAVLALVGSIGKYKICVAIETCDGCMSSAQGKSSSRVIESDPAANGLPILGSVACYAGYVELSMRTLRGSNGLRFFGGYCANGQRHREGE